MKLLIKNTGELHCQEFNISEIINEILQHMFQELKESKITLDETINSTSCKNTLKFQNKIYDVFLNHTKVMRDDLLAKIAFALTAIEHQERLEIKIIHSVTSHLATQSPNDLISIISVD